MRTKTRALTLLLLGAALSWSAAEAATLRQPVAKTYPFKPGDELFVGNVNGPVVITAWDRDEVRLDAEKVVKAGDQETAKRVMNEIQVVADATPGRLRIETRLPKRENGLFSWLSHKSIEMGVEYRLQVPRSLALTVENVNGRVEVTGAGGELALETVNGGIQVAGAQGTLRLTTTNGGIRVAETSGAVRARSVNGGVELALEDLPADGDVSVSTTNGGITLRAPASLRATVDARTTNGGVRSDLPITIEGKLNRRRLRGDLNGGGAKVELSTTNGSIRIVEI